MFDFLFWAVFALGLFSTISFLRLSCQYRKLKRRIITVSDKVPTNKKHGALAMQLSDELAPYFRYDNEKCYLTVVIPEEEQKK